MGARDLLAELSNAGISVVAEGSRLVIRPASMLTDEMRAALRASKTELLALINRDQPASEFVRPNDWTDAEVSAFLNRRARLIWWRWAEPDADRLASRLVERDREDDDRVSCTDCRHFRPGQCANYRRAGLENRSVGTDLAVLLQRCPGFSSATWSQSN